MIKIPARTGNVRICTSRHLLAISSQSMFAPTYTCMYNTTLKTRNMSVEIALTIFLFFKYLGKTVNFCNDRCKKRAPYIIS